jgi:hypothetical protein
MPHTLYVIQGQIYTTDDTGAFTGSRQIPTFYLDPAVQGITDENHARKIACEIIDPMGNLVLNIHVESSTVMSPPF